MPALSHDQVTRFLAKQELTEKDLWKIVKPHLRQIQSENAVLILDDSVEEKPYTDASELVCTHFDHVTGRYIKGINLLSCLYFSQNVSLPVNFHLIQKTQLVTDPKTGKEKWQSPKNKNEIAREMIGSAVNRQIPFRYVLNDIWFASAENMVFIQGKKKDFVMPLKSNRKVALSEDQKKQGKRSRANGNRSVRYRLIPRLRGSCIWRVFLSLSCYLVKSSQTKMVPRAFCIW